MKRLLTIATMVALAAMLVHGTGVQAAEKQEYKPKVASKSFFDGPLDGLDSKRTVIKEFILPPGYKGGAHYHPAHVFVYVVEGELAIDIPGKPRQTFKAGELYREKVGEVMVGGNASTTKPTKIVVFQIGDADKPMMIKTTK